MNLFTISECILLTHKEPMINAILPALRRGGSGFACASFAPFCSAAASEELELELLAGFSERGSPATSLSVAPGPATVASATASRRSACEGSWAVEAMTIDYFERRWQKGFGCSRTKTKNTKVVLGGQQCFIAAGRSLMM